MNNDTMFSEQELVQDFMAIITVVVFRSYGLGSYKEAIQHEVYFRADKAMQAFFRRVRNGEKPGFPRVKPRHTFFTLCYPAMYLSTSGRITVLSVGWC